MWCKDEAKQEWIQKQCTVSKWKRESKHPQWSAGEPRLAFDPE